jgi:hypothetical protein
VPPAAAVAVANEPADGLLVIRTGAHAEAPVGDHPWAARLAPPARATPRLRLRGPEEPADAIERALGP